MTDAGISTGAAWWWLWLLLPPLGVAPGYSSSHTRLQAPHTLHVRSPCTLPPAAPTAATLLQQCQLILAAGLRLLS